MEAIEVFADETVFRNDENGYTVLVVKSGKTRVSAVGIMPPIAPGEKLKITGDWVEHPIYGKQIKVSSCEIEKPTTISGIEKYLSSGMIRGIGPATAKLLIKAFGEETLDVLYSDPQRLLDVLVIAPATGNTVAKLAAGISDTSVTMAAKAHLRNGRPVVVAVASNDGLSAGARNIGELLNRKNYYFVPFGQDNAEQKPNSLVADFSRIPETVDAALKGEQIQPILLR